MPDTLPPFAQAVERVLKERGESTRGQRRLTGIPHSTLNGWFRGIPPSMENVVAFARGFGLEVNAWLELAGYPPLEEGEPSGLAIYRAGLKAYAQEFGGPPPPEAPADADMTPEEAFRRLAAHGLLREGSGPEPEGSYLEAHQRLYLEMANRLRADGYSLVPAPASHAGGTAGLTPADAAVEIAELERVFRKNFRPDSPS